jgi:hypothetical protein
MREFVLWDQLVNFVQTQALLLILTKIKAIQKPEFLKTYFNIILHPCLAPSVKFPLPS